MALQHPDVQVLGIHGVPLGVDTAPEKVPPRRIPANCQFSEYDINLGLSQYYDKFDVVHMRNISHGVSTLPPFSSFSSSLSHSFFFFFSSCEIS